MAANTTIKGIYAENLSKVCLDEYYFEINQCWEVQYQKDSIKGVQE